MPKQQQDLAKILEQIDIIALAESYGFEFKQRKLRMRAKKNLLRDEATSSIDFFIDSNRFYDRATGKGGDAFDLIAGMEMLSITDSIIRAKQMIGMDNYDNENKIKRVSTPKTVAKVKKIDLKKIYGQSKTDLRCVSKKAPFFIFNDDRTEAEEHIKINTIFKNLFETEKMNTCYFKKLEYIFKNLVGWSDYWNSPTIVLKDINGLTVDLVAYRPKDKETNKEIKGMKYHYRNFNSRGENFLYPFQKEIEVIIKREKYILIGEGLKNALNGVLHGVPFISIESTGNTLNLSTVFISHIKKYIEMDYGFATAFDGDEAGKEAYNNFLKLSGLSADNILSFDSNIDFTEHLRAN